MSSIKDFVAADDQTMQKNEQKLTISQPKLEKTKADYGDLIELFLTKYGQMNEDELIAEMLKLIQQKKDEGTYNPQELKDLAARVKPFLDDEQIAKMESMLKYL